MIASQRLGSRPMGTDNPISRVLVEDHVSHGVWTASGDSVLAGYTVLYSLIAFATVEEGNQDMLPSPVGFFYPNLRVVGEGRGSQVFASMYAKGPVFGVLPAGRHPEPVYVWHDAYWSKLPFVCGSRLGDQRDDRVVKHLRPLAVFLPGVIKLRKPVQPGLGEAEEFLG